MRKTEVMSMFYLHATRIAQKHIKISCAKSWRLQLRKISVRLRGTFYHVVRMSTLALNLHGSYYATHRILLSTMEITVGCHCQTLSRATISASESMPPQFSSSAMGGKKAKLQNGGMSMEAIFKQEGKRECQYNHAIRAVGVS